jgi:hypothetical protein
VPVGHNRKGRSKGNEPFVKLPWYMLDAAAWRELSTAERALYIEIVRAFNGHNNGFIALSVRQASERCNINKDTAGRAFKRLEEIGFIDCVTPGGFSRKIRHATEWRLTLAPCNLTGQPATKRFMSYGRGQTQNTVRKEASTVP